MLEQDEQGNLTGYIVQNYTPEFRAAKDKFMNEKLDDGYALNEIQWASFFQEDNTKNRYNKWLKNAPETYKSKKIEEINNMEESDPRKQYYDFYMKHYDEAQSFLPKSYQRGKALPGLRATQAERWFMNPEHDGVFRGSANAIREKMLEVFGKAQDNILWGEYVDAAGDPMSYIPVHYSTRIGNQEGQLSPADVSYDLTSSLKMYYTMATNFNEMQQILPEIEAAKELIETFDVPTITFSESVKFADELTKACFPWAVSYHSKIGKYRKVKAIEEFNDKKSDIKVISTARALDEGFDIQDVTLAIVCSGTSTSRQDLQRTGRAIRFAPGKTGLIVNLYIKETQDEKWLRNRQKKTINATHVESIKQIKEALSQASLNYLNVEQ